MREREPALDREVGELAAFRPLPSVLQPPPTPLEPPTAARAELARAAAEQLVTRLRVGRTREGALVELRVRVGGRELDVRLAESANGVTLHTDDDALRSALVQELGRRGVRVEANT